MEKSWKIENMLVGDIFIQLCNYNVSVISDLGGYVYSEPFSCFKVSVKQKAECYELPHICTVKKRL